MDNLQNDNNLSGLISAATIPDINNIVNRLPTAKKRQQDHLPQGARDPFYFAKQNNMIGVVSKSNTSDKRPHDVILPPPVRPNTPESCRSGPSSPVYAQSPRQIPKEILNVEIHKLQLNIIDDKVETDKLLVRQETSPCERRSRRNIDAPRSISPSRKRSTSPARSRLPRVATLPHKYPPRILPSKTTVGWSPNAALHVRNISPSPVHIERPISPGKSLPRVATTLTASCLRSPVKQRNYNFCIHEKSYKYIDGDVPLKQEIEKLGVNGDAIRTSISCSAIRSSTGSTEISSQFAPGNKAYKRLHTIHHKKYNNAEILMMYCDIARKYYIAHMNSSRLLKIYKFSDKNVATDEYNMLTSY
jgi:hypothetical protein